MGNSVIAHLNTINHSGKILNCFCHNLSLFALVDLHQRKWKLMTIFGLVALLLFLMLLIEYISAVEEIRKNFRLV